MSTWKKEDLLRSYTGIIEKKKRKEQKENSHRYDIFSAKQEWVRLVNYKRTFMPTYSLSPSPPPSSFSSNTNRFICAVFNEEDPWNTSKWGNRHTTTSLIVIAPENKIKSKSKGQIHTVNSNLNFFSFKKNKQHGILEPQQLLKKDPHQGEKAMGGGELRGRETKQRCLECYLLPTVIA